MAPRAPQALPQIAARSPPGSQSDDLRMTTAAPDVPVLNNYRTVVSAFIDFLTVCIHTIIFERDIYPQTSFLTARKYNCPVKQSRHPQVCRWIQDAVAAVQAEMLKVSLRYLGFLLVVASFSCASACVVDREFSNPIR